jgi:hypothetical protein
MQALGGRGWVWRLAALWVVIGAGGAIYVTVAFSHPGWDEGLLIPPTIQWPGEPQVINAVGVIAEVAWLLLSLPLLVAGFVRLRGWRARNWVRAGGWVGSWVAGLVLMDWAGGLAVDGFDGGTRGVLTVGELAICAAWLLLGGAMTWILSSPQTRADSSSDSNVATH